MGKTAIIIGGGFFGSQIALALANKGLKVLLVEAEKALLTRSSYHNQARIHNGYHYPRSLLTALRSRVNFPRFVSEFPECVDHSFDKYYAVSSVGSKVNATQFRRFCETIEAEIHDAPAEISALFDKRLIEKVFTVREYAFNAVKLRERMAQELEDAKVKVLLETRCVAVHASDDGLMVTLRDAQGGTQTIPANLAFNCTYSGINTVLKSSKLSPLPLKHEFTEMALIDLPEPLKSIGVTVMCGPFFSFMPFPARNLHSFSHVRYTPHASWRDEAEHNNDDLWQQLERTSHYDLMLRDASRYIPLLREAKRLDSLWEIKTILPQSEFDDSRPILFHRHPQLPGLVSILGGKIDNVFDLSQEMESIL